MSRVCAHCGEMYAEERLNCPHCGADADLTYVDDPGWVDGPGTEEVAYEEFLEKEGLKEPETGAKRRSGGGGCALVLAGGTISGLLWLLT